MTGYSQSPRLLKAGLALVDPQSGNVGRIISLQYNPENLKRSLDIQAVEDSGNRSSPLRLTGPAVEKFTLEATLDGTDQLEFPDDNPSVTISGILPALSVLESLVHPTSQTLQRNNQLASSGTLEIAPMETPLAVFIWGPNRIAPVRVTELSFTEEAFDPSLNPIRAKVSLGLRVLSVDDLGFEHRGSSLFMNYLKAKEKLAGQAARGSLNKLGVEALP